MNRPGTEINSIVAGSPDRFGYEWNEYAEMRPEYEEQFRRWTVHLTPADWRGKRFLDVGCGMGRNSYWPMVYGAASGVAIDVDARSLAAARRTLAQFPTVRVEERSAYDIPANSDFDIAFSIGVIHHLEHPQQAVRAMTEAVAPGGRVLIWVYGLENNRWIVAVLSPLRNVLFSRLPIGIVHHFSLYPTVALWLVLKLGFSRLPYYKLLRGFTFRHLRSIVFDQMLPKIANYWSKESVEELLRGAGLTDIRLVWVNEMSWSAIGNRTSCGAVADSV